jgi:hypothetical protein
MAAPPADLHDPLAAPASFPGLAAEIERPR